MTYLLLRLIQLQTGYFQTHFWIYFCSQTHTISRCLIKKLYDRSVFPFFAKDGKSFRKYYQNWFFDRISQGNSAGKGKNVLYEKKITHKSRFNLFTENFSYTIHFHLHVSVIILRVKKRSVRALLGRKNMFFRVMP